MNKNLKVKKINKSCKYYPCHQKLEDCTFCYCPLYPCLKSERGGYFILDKKNKKIWSCEKCNWIHNKKNIDEFFNLIRKNDNEQFPEVSSKTLDIGIIILAHGTKLEKANNIILDIIKYLKKKMNLKNIKSAFLQFNDPDLSKTIKTLADKGCKKIIIVPFFLFNGNHVTCDIPEIIKQEEINNKNIKFILTKSLGGNFKEISDIVLNNIKEGY